MQLSRNLNLYQNLKLLGEKKQQRDKRDTGEEIGGINNRKKRCSSGQEFFIFFNAEDTDARRTM